MEETLLKVMDAVLFIVAFHIFAIGLMVERYDAAAVAFLALLLLSAGEEGTTGGDKPKG